MRTTPRAKAARAKKAGKMQSKRSGHTKHHVGTHRQSLGGVVIENQERLDVIEKTIGEKELSKFAEPGKGGY